MTHSNFDHNTEFQDKEIFIDRHENPYTLIQNELIRNELLTPLCRWILIYILSNHKTRKQVLDDPLLIKFNPSYFIKLGVELGYLNSKYIEVSHE